MIGNTFNYFDEMNQSKNKLGTVRSMQVDPLFDNNFPPLKSMGTCLNNYDQFSFSIAEMKLMTDLDAVE